MPDGQADPLTEPKTRRRRILVIEPDQEFTAILKDFLESQKFEVRTASNGTEALEAVAQNKPHVIVLDVMMDHLSEGFDVARKLKEDPETAKIPVIMLTAVDKVYDYRMEIEGSFFPHDRYLEKPVDPERLLAEIDGVLTAIRS